MFELGCRACPWFLHFKPLSVRDDLATGATAPQASVGVRVLLSFWTVPSEPGVKPGRGRDGPLFLGSARPPRRSRRARLTHRAPALGSGVEPPLGPGMQDSGLR